jgi:hypothetical protein
MNRQKITVILVSALIIVTAVAGCITPQQKITNTYPQNNPSTSNPSSPIDFNNYAQMASESASTKTVAVIVSPDNSGLIWQGGPDISTITSWQAKLSDGTSLIESSSAPSVGQFDEFHEKIEGKYLLVTAKFSDGHEQVILATTV